MTAPHFVFFGTPKLATIVLNELARAELFPTLIVTTPDKPVGRGLTLTPTSVKSWAQEHTIEVLEVDTLDDDAIARLEKENADVFVVVAYGHILTKKVLDIPKMGAINVHPSLLPTLRGPSPVRSAILEDHRVVGVSIMLLDEKMDHGPLLTQEVYEPSTWPPNAQELDAYLFTRGGTLLAEVLPQYVRSDLTPQEQDHDNATYCSLFTKEDGHLNLSDDAYQNLLKIHAYAGWPGTFFFTEKNGIQLRIKVVSAHIEEDELVLDEVIPEGGHKMSYQDFLATT